MTAAQLAVLKERDLLDLGAHIGFMREAMSAHAAAWGFNQRGHTFQRPTLRDGRLVLESHWLFTEGLN